MLAPPTTFEDFVQINPPEHPLRGRNALVSARRTWHSSHEHRLPTSIKYAISGAIDVETKRGKYHLSEGSFIVVNAWEPYTFTIPPGSAAQTFSLFFRPGYLPSVQTSVLSSDAASLERDPNERMTPYLEFVEASFPSVQQRIGERLRALFHAWQAGASQHCLSDRFRSLAEALVKLRCGVSEQLDGINAVKRTTRLELFRRTQQALIFVRENYAKDIDLNVVARHVGMAPHHLHRVFRAIQGSTLHRCIVNLRLEEAKRLLEKTEVPIGRICTQVGYSSLPSFVRLFHSRFGQPPSSFRRSL